MAGIIPQQTVSWFNNTPYIDNRQDWSNSAFSQLGAMATRVTDKNMPHLLQQKQLIPLQMPNQQPAHPAQPQQQGAMTGNFPSALGNQFNKLSQNASDALYGGILGYQPKPITSPTGSMYSPPTDQGFQFPYGLLNRNFFPGA
jgi:CubicO group peptidase (beta-lactamase class C family)